MDDSYKLPVKHIIKSSLFTLWANKYYFSKALAIPILLLILVWSTWYLYGEKTSGFFSWGMMFLFLYFYCVFAITCHRLVLLKGDFDFYNLKSYFSRRSIIFFMWALLLYAVVLIIDMASMTILYQLDDFKKVNFQDEQYYWLTLPFYIPGLYFFGRICLIFPAKAIDEKAYIKRSWLMTKNNAWRMFIIIGFYPWLLSMILWFVSREDGSIYENVFITLLEFIFLAIEVCALSFTYKEFIEQK